MRHGRARLLSRPEGPATVVYRLLWYRIPIGHAPLIADVADVAARLTQTLGS